MADMNRETGETQGTARGRASPGMQESEEAGMEQMSRVLREAREEGDPEMQEPMQGRTGSTETGMEGEPEDYDVVIITVREYAISERERGMSDRERGMSERERAMFDRECAMSDRERSSAWGGREEESSSGGMTSGRSRPGGQSGSSQAGMNR